MASLPLRPLVFLLFVALVLGFLGSFLRALAVPLVFSGFLTYLLVPVVAYLERRKISRNTATLGVLTMALSLLGVAISAVLPQVVGEVTALVQHVPSLYNYFLEHTYPELREWAIGLGMNSDIIDDFVERGQVASRVAGQLQGALGTLGTSAGSLVGGVMNALMVPVITFFWVRDIRGFRDTLMDWVPNEWHETLRRLGTRLSATLATVLKSQLIVAMTLAVLYVLGLSIVGLDAAVAIGIVAGVCRMVPYLDVVVGGLLSAIVILSHETTMGTVVGVASVFAIVQTVDGMFITPRVVGEKVGLHPLVVILSVLVLGSRFGFYGILLAVPAVAALRVLLDEARPLYRATFFRS